MASLWVLMAFLTFFALLGKRLWRGLIGLLDQRAEDVRQTIKEADALKYEAEQYLAQQRKILSDAEEQAKRIIAHAEIEAENLKHEAKHQIVIFQKNQERLLHDKVTRLELQLKEQFKSRLIEEALENARANLTDAQNDLSYFEESLRVLETVDLKNTRLS